MAHIGDTIHNPVTGETATFHLTSADTGGALARVEFRVRPGGGVYVRHVHRTSEERFEVLSGRVELEIGRRRVTLGPGERAAVPAGVAHRWRTVGSGELRMMVEIDPAGSFEGMLEDIFALGRAGRLNAKGMARPLDMARLMRRNGEDTYAAGVPLVVQRFVLRLLAGLADRRPSGVLTSQPSGQLGA